MNEAVAEQPAADTSAPATPIPAISYSSAPALEVRPLGGGEKITQKQMIDELIDLGTEWRLETSAEQYALVDRSYKNQHGARSRDESLQPGWYWSADTLPGVPGARVVVGFYLGYVLYYSGSHRAFARAVRVSGQ